MFNQRTNPLYQTLRDLIAGGELGEVTRVSWIVDRLVPHLDVLRQRRLAGHLGRRGRAAS